jgi:hypothetical protein
MPHKTTCACGSTQFEAAVVELRNSSLSAFVVQCVECGQPIGILDTWENSQIKDFLKEYQKPPAG